MARWFILKTFAFFFAMASSAAASTFTYEGYLEEETTPGVFAPASGTKTIRVDIMGGSCRLYSEIHVKALSDGHFALDIGASGTLYGEPSMAALFEDRVVNGDACTFGGTGVRKLRIFVDGAQMPADIAITSAPLAMTSNRIGAFSESQLLRVAGGGTVAPLSPAQIGELQALLDGTSSSLPPASLRDGVDWSEVAGKPATFTPAVHTHFYSDLQNGAGKYLNYAPNGVACSSGEVLKWNSVDARWDCGVDLNGGGGGGVTSVTASSPLSSSGGSTPNLSIADASTSGKGVVQLASSGDTTAGLVVQASDARLTDARAPTGTASGDLSGSYPNPSVVKMRGVSVSATAPSFAGQVLRYDGISQYVPAALAISDITNLSTQLGNKLDQANMPANCGAAQTLNFSSPTGAWSCVNINGLDAGTITSGTVATVRLGAGSADNTKFLRGDQTWATPTVAETDPKIGTMTANSIPKWTGAVLQASNLYENSGRVGIGTSTPSNPLTIQGNLNGMYMARIQNNDSSGSSFFATSNDAVNSLFFGVTGTGFSGTGVYEQKSAVVYADTNLNSLNIGTEGVKPVKFFIGNSEKMRLDENGNLGLGVAANASGRFEIATENVSGVLLMNTATNGASVASGLTLQTSSGTLGAPAALAAGADLGQLRFRGRRFSGYSTAATIVARSAEAFTDTSTATELRFATTPFGSTSAVDRVTIKENGAVGIGTTQPRTGLDVNGAILPAPAVSNSVVTIDFSKGNIQFTTLNCTSFQLNHLKDGGTYTFVVKGPSSATCAFSTYSDGGTTLLTFHAPLGHGPTIASKHTLYNFIVVGSDVYASWMPGL